MDLLFDTLILLFIGLCGWLIFSFLRLPVADLLGSMTAVALLRIFFAPLPIAPGFFSPLIQICLGLYIGSKVTREKIGHIKTLLKPALIIVSWVMLIAFVAGILMAQVTSNSISLITGILSSTMGGLPEMTIIAMETEADVTVVVVMKTIRMILTVTFFPIIFEKWLAETNGSKTLTSYKAVNRKYFLQNIALSIYDEYQKLHKLFAEIELGNFADHSNFVYAIKYGLLSFVIAAIGGLFFRYMQVPAGAMVGGMFFVIVASLLGFSIKTVPLKLLILLRVGLGIVIADNISIEVFSVFTSSAFLLATALNTVIVFSTFIFVMYIIHLVTGWDYQTCFLSASPAGFTIMIILASKYDKDVFSISMLHLCRLLVVKTVFPFLFMKIL